MEGASQDIFKDKYLLVEMSDSDVENVDMMSPARGITRKLADRSNDSETLSPETKKPYIDSDELKIWLKSQFATIREDIKTECGSLRSEVNDLRTELASKDKTISDLENNVATLSNTVDDLQAVVDVQKMQIQDLVTKLDDHEQHSRRQSLRFTKKNGTFTPEEDYSKFVTDLAADMGVVMSPDDIDRSHTTDKDNKQIIVKFTTYKARYRMYSNKKNLKGLNKDVFISEDLTKTRYEMFKQLLELRKQKLIDSAWTNDGRLFVAKNNSKILIRCTDDIDKLRQ